MRAGADMRAQPHCVWSVAAQLGEGPIWMAAEQSLWFVDIKEQHIHRYQADTGQTQTWHAPAQPGFIMPMTGNEFIVGLKTGLHYFYPQRHDFTLLTQVEPALPNNRLNDACVDARGRLWFGSMDDGEQLQTGNLYRLDANGMPLLHDTDYCITNGPAISPDGATLYHTDTLARCIHAFDLSADGRISNKRLFTSITTNDGYPDGPVVDSEGCVWTGLYGGWGLLRFSPQGELIDRIDLPCANVTKAAFGGADLRTLYITTAWKGLNAEQRAQQPLAGGLFAVRVRTPGLPQYEVQLD